MKSLSLETLTTSENLPLNINPLAIWGGFLLAFVIFVAFSIVLVYHWRRYDWSNKNVKKAFTMYFAGSAVLFLIAVVIAVFLT